MALVAQQGRVVTGDGYLIILYTKHLWEKADTAAGLGVISQLDSTEKKNQNHPREMFCFSSLLHRENYPPENTILFSKSCFASVFDHTKSHFREHLHFSPNEIVFCPCIIYTLSLTVSSLSHHFFS